MLDPDSIGTGLVVLGTAEVTKDAVQRLLAPTADYLGVGLLRGSKATVNAVRVLVNATKRLGAQLDEPGQVPPRVMRETLDQALFCDDELTAEYLGGILASSYSDVERDDRAASLLSTLRRLSTYAVHTHYVCYREYCRLFQGRLTFTSVAANLPNQRIAEDTRVLAGTDGYSEAIGFTGDEDFGDIYSHVSSSLGREDLLHLGPMGDPAFLATELADREAVAYQVPEHGFICRATTAGSELFLWGLGHGDLGSWLDHLLLDDTRELDIALAGVPEVGGFYRLSDLRVKERIPPTTL